MMQRTSEESPTGSSATPQTRSRISREASHLFSKIAHLRGSQIARPLVFAFDRFVNFLSVHRNVLGRVNAQSNFVSAYVDNRNYDIVTDHDALVAVP
jgi:hypothetical protein